MPKRDEAEVLAEVLQLDLDGKFLRDFDEIRATAGALSPLWGDFLYKGHITSIVGDAGVCKTTLWYALTVKLCRGLPFLGFHPECEIRVAGLDWESSDELIGSRAELIDPTSIKTPFFKIFNNPEYTLTDILPLLVSKIKELNINVLQIDNQTTAFNTYDENDNSEGRRQMQILRGLTRETNVAIVVYHHPSKANAPGMRKGSGAYVRARMADLMFNINEVDNHAEIIQLECTKDRLAGKKGELWYIEKNEGEFKLLEKLPDDIEQLPDKKPVDIAQNLIMKLLRETLEMSRREIVDRLLNEDMKVHTVDNALKLSKRMGRIEEVPNKYGYYRRRVER